MITKTFIPEKGIKPFTITKTSPAIARKPPSPHAEAAPPSRGGRAALTRRPRRPHAEAAPPSRGGRAGGQAERLRGGVGAGPGRAVGGQVGRAPISSVSGTTTAAKITVIRSDSQNSGSDTIVLKLAGRAAPRWRTGSPPGWPASGRPAAPG